WGDRNRRQGHKPFGKPSVQRQRSSPHLTSGAASTRSLPAACGTPPPTPRIEVDVSGKCVRRSDQDNSSRPARRLPLHFPRCRFATVIRRQPSRRGGFPVCWSGSRESHHAPWLLERPPILESFQPGAR